MLSAYHTPGITPNLWHAMRRIPQRTSSRGCHHHFLGKETEVREQRNNLPKDARILNGRARVPRIESHVCLTSEPTVWATDIILLTFYWGGLRNLCDVKRVWYPCDVWDWNFIFPSRLLTRKSLFLPNTLILIDDVLFFFSFLEYYLELFLLQVAENLTQAVLIGEESGEESISPHCWKLQSCLRFCW